MAGSRNSHDDPVGIHAVPLVAIVLSLCGLLMCSMDFQEALRRWLLPEPGPLEGKFEVWLPKDTGPREPKPPATPKEIRVTLLRDEANSTTIRKFGTTTVRALEAAAADGTAEGEATLFIRPGHRFRAVDALLTNFHLPRSSLLLLVAAFAGRARVLDAYAHAVATGYRFYSYGDAMLIKVGV